MHGPKAAGADLDPLYLTVHWQGHLVHVGQKPGLCTSFRVADVVARHAFFVTDFALHYILNAGLGGLVLFVNTRQLGYHSRHGLYKEK